MIFVSVKPLRWFFPGAFAMIPSLFYLMNYDIKIDRKGRNSQGICLLTYIIPNRKTMAAEEVLYIGGGTKLTGEGEAQGAKNAALPMIAASVLAEQGQTVLHRVPPVKDVLVALEILRQLGAKVDFDAAAGDLVIDASGIHTTALPADLTGRMRASILFVGPLLSRFRTVSVEEVGGCNIGERATDYHYRGFARMGAKVEGTRAGGYRVEAEKLIGANMYCDLPSHTGVENLVMAASLAKGESTIVNAASDPEIADFAQLLGKMGAQVEGVGTRTVRIRGTGPSARRRTHGHVRPPRCGHADDGRCHHRGGHRAEGCQPGASRGV